MRLFILFFIVTFVFIEMAIGWQAIISRYDLKYVNEKRLKIINATLFKYNRTTKAVSFVMDIYYDLPTELMIEIKVYGFMSNRYRLLPLVITRSVCDILELEFQWIRPSMNCNFHDKCPVPKGRYFLKDYSVDVSRFPKRAWSIDDFMIAARVYFRKEDEILIDVYVHTTDDDEYVV